MAEWIRSSFCSDSGCLEVRFDAPGLVAIRDTGCPSVQLVIRPAEWAAFIAGAKNGEFDLPEGANG